MNESKDFYLGQQVGESIGRAAEQERIIEIIQNMEITITDIDDEPVEILKMDWDNLIEQIRNPEED